MRRCSRVRVDVRLRVCVVRVPSRSSSLARARARALSHSHTHVSLFPQWSSYELMLWRFVVVLSNALGFCLHWAALVLLVLFADEVCMRMRPIVPMLTCTCMLAFIKQRTRMHLKVRRSRVLAWHGTRDEHTHRRCAFAASTRHGHPSIVPSASLRDQLMAVA